jgi:phage shock protein A
MAMGREDLARLAIERKQMAVTHLADLDRQVGNLELEQQRLVQAEARLAVKVQAFQTHKEVIKAQYTAAEAEVRVSEAVNGLSEEFADVGLAMRRAEEKTQKLRARASAIDELVAEGTLESYGDKRDLLESELDKLALTQSVDSELAALRRQIAAPEPPKALPEGR